MRGKNHLNSHPALVLFCLVTILSVAKISFAAGGGHAVGKGVLLKDFLYRLLNFALLFGALAYVLAKPLRKGLKDRRTKLIASLEGADMAKRTAEAKLAECEKKFINSDQEIKELLAKAIEENELERSRVLAEAQAIAAAVRKEARQCADREIERARRELRNEAANMALRMAEEILRQKVTDADRSRLVQENLQQIESQS